MNASSNVGQFALLAIAILAASALLPRVLLYKPDGGHAVGLRGESEAARTVV